jgi:hypothetical protein
MIDTGLSASGLKMLRYTLRVRSLNGKWQILIFAEGIAELGRLLFCVCIMYQAIHNIMFNDNSNSHPFPIPWIWIGETGNCFVSQITTLLVVISNLIYLHCCWLLMTLSGKATSYKCRYVHTNKESKVCYVLWFQFFIYMAFKISIFFK